jgi:hypothetical protein
MALDYLDNIMKPIFFIFIKLGPKNVFVNVYKNEGDKRTPLLSRTLNSSNYIKKEYHPHLTTLNEFIETLAEWVKLKKPTDAGLVLVFNDFGVKFKKKAQTSQGLYKKRTTIIKIFRREKIAISEMVDVTTVPFNGCTQKKKRRKKKKGYRKHDIV